MPPCCICSPADPRRGRAIKGNRERQSSVLFNGHIWPCRVLGLHDMMMCFANFAELLLREFAKRWGILSAMKSLPRRQKRPVGRPTSYRREYCARIIKAMASGLSAEAAAAKIGISARSLFYWQREHPEFLQAIQEGRQQGLLWWEKRAQATSLPKSIQNAELTGFSANC
jgi:hypothetical protein